MTRTTPKALNDQMYSMKLEAGRLGHALKGKPRCICGFKASSPAELDDHLYGIVHPKSDHHDDPHQPQHFASEAADRR